jgi:hypothetical protein
MHREAGQSICLSFATAAAVTVAAANQERERRFNARLYICLFMTMKPLQLLHEL